MPRVLPAWRLVIVVVVVGLLGSSDAEGKTVDAKRKQARIRTNIKNNNTKRRARRRLEEKVAKQVSGPVGGLRMESKTSRYERGLSTGEAPVLAV